MLFHLPPPACSQESQGSSSKSSSAGGAHQQLQHRPSKSLPEAVGDTGGRFPAFREDSDPLVGSPSTATSCRPDATPMSKAARPEEKEEERPDTGPSSSGRQQQGAAAVTASVAWALRSAAGSIRSQLEAAAGGQLERTGEGPRPAATVLGILLAIVIFRSRHRLLGLLRRLVQLLWSGAKQAARMATSLSPGFL